MMLREKRKSWKTSSGAPIVGRTYPTLDNYLLFLYTAVTLTKVPKLLFILYTTYANQG